MVQAPPIAPEPEILLRRELLDEPLPGSGWQPSVASIVDDETVETSVHETPAVLLGAEEPTTESVMIEEVVEAPLMEEVVEAPLVDEIPAGPMGPGTAGVQALEQAAGVMGAFSGGEERLPPEDISRVDDLKSRIEETRRRIRHELEQPFDPRFAAKPPASDWTTAPAVPVVEAAFTAPVTEPPVPVVEPPVPVVEPPVPAPITMEPLVVQEETVTEPPLTVEIPTLETVEVDLLPAERVVMEDATFETGIVEPVAEVAPPAVAPAPAPVAETAPLVEPTLVEPTLVAPLVESPVPVAEPLVPVAEPPVPAPITMEPLVVQEETVTEPPLTVEIPTLETVEVDMLPAEPVAEVSPPAVAPAPAAETVPLVEPPVPVVEPTLVAPLAESPAPVAEPLAPVAEPLALSDEDLTAEVSVEEPVDYDSMKSRIESTRSRLKAKAFDAMMTGEAALLGRDLEGRTRSNGDVAGVDSDIDETIETSLREEEE